MMELLTSSEAWIGLLTLAALEIVLGIDNIVFISILAAKLPKDQQLKARRLGLAWRLSGTVQEPVSLNVGLLDIQHDSSVPFYAFDRRQWSLSLSSVF